jgi:hypothetical protein
MREATPEELVQALAFALQFKGRKRVNHAADFMARVAAQNLVEYLKQSGFVVMKKPEGPTPDASSQYRFRENPQETDDLS